MANIEELQRALRQGSDAKARLSGLDEQYQQAQDRGVATTKKDQYGQVSPLSVLADVVGQSRSRRDMRELAPQREAARSNIAQHENAQGLFNAVRQQEQDNQIQANWTDGHALKLAQQSQSEAREVSRQEELAAKIASDNARYTEKENQGTGAPVGYVGPDGTPHQLTLMNNGKWMDENRNVIDSINGWSKVPNREQQVVGFGSGNKHIEKMAVTAMERLDQVDRIHTMAGGLTEADRKSMASLNSQFIDVGIDMLSPDSMAPLIRDKLTNYSKPVKQFLTNLASLGAKERHELFGAALTTAELKSSSEFSPKINGVPLDVIENRLDRMYGESRTQLQTYDKFVDAASTNYSAAYADATGRASTRWKENNATGGLRVEDSESGEGAGSIESTRAKIADLRAQIAAAKAAEGNL